jgi:putative transcriptional regulator
VNIFDQQITPMKERIKINRIKSILIEKDMTQKELAGRIGRTPTSVTRICNNDSQPALGLLRTIALELNVDIRELLVPTPVRKED